MSEFRLDRTYFKAHTAEEASDHSAYYRKLSWQERLRISAHLISVAYNYPAGNPPRLDRTAFRANSRN